MSGQGFRGLLAAVLLAVGGLFSASAQASNIPLGSLQDLINAGQTGVIIGDKRFYNFSLQPPLNGAPSASQISVAGLMSPNIGLQFSASWFAIAGSTMDSVIQYCVQVLDSTQQIGAVGLSFNGTSPVPAVGTFATVNEQVMHLDGSVIGNVSVFSDANTPFPDHLQGTLTLSPPLSAVCVSKDIQVVSSANGVATISVVDNTFPQVPTGIPLPASAWTGLLLLGLMVGGKLARRGLRFA